MIRVLLVDDHAVLRAGFRMILSAQDDIEVVGEASNGAEAVAAASTLLPDVICMDVQMPDMNGIEATRLIVADAAVSASIVIVTTFDRDDYLFSALDAGASGFLLKNAGPEELVTAVRTIANGDALLAPEVTRRVIERFGAGGASGTGEGGPGTAGTGIAGTGIAGTGIAGTGITGAGIAGSARHPPHASAPPSAPATEPLSDALTEREAEVLQLLAQAMSNAEIAHALFIGEATVKTHVSKVLQKLGARDRVQAVVYAYRRGLA